MRGIIEFMSLGLFTQLGLRHLAGIPIDWGKEASTAHRTGGGPSKAKLEESSPTIVTPLRIQMSSDAACRRTEAPSKPCTYC
jgi:hypothetical protein